MAKNPADRFQTAKELEEALRQDPQHTPHSKVKRRLSLPRITTAAIGVATVILIGVIIVLFLGKGPTFKPVFDDEFSRDSTKDYASTSLFSGDTPDTLTVK